MTTQLEVKIRMVFKKDGEEKTFLLIPHSILNWEKVYIPELYLKQYQCWIDEQRNILIFRRRTLETMNKVGLILMYKLEFSKLLDAD
jgi:hypothetical protein